MAELAFKYKGKVTPDANPKTLLQIITPTHQRVVLHAIELQPFGSTGASAPIEFDLAKQTTAGTASAGSFVKIEPAASETLQTTCRDTFTVEPTLGSSEYTFNLHQQGSRLWIPPTATRRLILPGNERWGLRCLSTIDFNIGFVVILEE